MLSFLTLYCDIRPYIFVFYNQLLYYVYGLGLGSTEGILSEQLSTIVWLFLVETFWSNILDSPAICPCMTHLDWESCTPNIFSFFTGAVWLKLEFRRVRNQWKQLLFMTSKPKAIFHLFGGIGDCESLISNVGLFGCGLVWY